MESAQAQLLPINGSLVEASSFAPVAVNQQAQGLTTNHGDIVLAGGNANIQNHYHNYQGEPKLNILSALRFVRNLRKIHLDVLSKATPGTGTWWLKTDMFILWLDLDGTLKILWGTGIPGAGKTIMASLVIEEVETRATAVGGNICVCYVYFRYSEASDMTVRNILEILVKQTVERHPECASLAEEVYTRHLHEDTQPTEVELLQLLHRFARGKSATFYILDALDEAPDKVQLELVKKLASLDVRLFITSRLLNGIENCVSGIHNFPIVAQGHDLELHINDEIEKSLDLQNLLNKAGPSLKREIVTSIKEKCNGMFLHASLQLVALAECLSPGEVRRTLEVFPPSIEDVYLQTWSRILTRNPNRVLLAKTVLLWVINASRPMTIKELERAVATSPKTYKFEPDEVVPGMNLVTLCRGLVTFEGKSGVVRLVHYTAKGTLQNFLQDSFPHPHSHLAAVCVTHLTDSGFQNTEITSEEEFDDAYDADPLLAYSSDAWAIHARASLDDEDTRQRVANFISDARAFPAFTSPDFLAHFDILNRLHILANYNLPMTLLANDNIGDPNVTTQIKQQSPLMLASCHGHTEHFTFLIVHPKIKVNLVNDSGWSALMLAASSGHEGIVKMLLTHLEIQVNLVSDKWWSALMLAANNGYKGVVKLLLAHSEVQVNLVDDIGWSALMLAADDGYECVVKLLLAHSDVQVNMVDGIWWSALMLAADNGHEGIVTLLLAHSEVQVNLVDGIGWSALMLAADKGHKGVVKILLAHSKIQVNLVDGIGWSALMLAANNGHEDIVKLLLAHSDIRANTVNRAGVSPLMLDARYCHKIVLNLHLARAKLQVKLVNRKEWSVVLMEAARNGRECIVKLLLVHPNIQVNSVDREGLSPLMLAASNSHEGIVKILLARTDVLVNLPSKTGLSALMLAASNGHEGVTKLLLACCDSQVNSVDNEGSSALMKAARNGHRGIVKLLLAHSEIQVNSVEIQGWSALMQAAHSGRDGIVALLLTRTDILVNLVDDEGWSALMLAAHHGRNGIVTLLLMHADILVNLVDDKGWSALMLAASEGHEDNVKLLLAHRKILVNLVDNKRWSALMMAARHGREGVVKLLLARSEIQVNSVNNKGWSALILAAKFGHESIVRLLLDVSRINTSFKTTCSGRTAMSLALGEGHTGIVCLLKEFESRQTRTESGDLIDDDMDQFPVGKAIDEEMGGTPTDRSGESPFEVVLAIDSGPRTTASSSKKRRAPVKAEEEPAKRHKGTS